MNSYKFLIESNLDCLKGHSCFPLQACVVWPHRAMFTDVKLNGECRAVAVFAEKEKCEISNKLMPRGLSVLVPSILNSAAEATCSNLRTLAHSTKEKGTISLKATPLLNCTMFSTHSQVQLTTLKKICFQTNDSVFKLTSAFEKIIYSEAGKKVSSGIARLHRGASLRT